MEALRPVYLVGGKRVPFMKSMTKYLGVTTEELMTQSLSALVFNYNLNGKSVGDVALGAVMNSASKWGLARESVLGSGLSPMTSAYYVQRACGTGLEATWQICMKIASRQIDEGIAGGVDTNSDLPIEISDKLKRVLLAANAERSLAGKMRHFLSVNIKDLAPKFPAVVEPRTGKSMGEHCEDMVKEWHISRESQDELALQSHLNAARAYKEGFFDDMVVEFKGSKMDGTVRGDTTLEKLAKLKPAFDKETGTLTAGNSSPLTDGSSAVLLSSEESMKVNNWKPLARFVDAQNAALDYVSGDGLLMAPTIAVSKLLERNKLTLQDFDYYEIHEAFAGQVLCTLKAWEDDSYCRKYLGRDRAMGPIDRTKMNVMGSSLAVGHPFAATGGRIVATLGKILSKKSKSRGLISICTAGGMGVAAIFESV